MQQGIHPEYKDITVTCSCGNSFKTRSTVKKELLQIEVCSACHPFFVGGHRIVDSMGRVEKFNKKFEKIYVKAKDKPAKTGTSSERTGG